MSSIEIYGFPGSTYVRSARMTCEEKGLRHALRPLEFRAPSHRALHPFLRMPVLRAGEVVLYETLAVAVYLDEAFPGPSLQPKETSVRARMFQWISACNDYFYDHLVRAMMKAENTSAQDIAAAQSDMEVVDRALTGDPFLAGPQLTLADLFLAPMLAYASGNAEVQGTVDALPALKRWYQHMSARASFEATQS